MKLYTFEAESNLLDPYPLCWCNQQTRQYYGREMPFEASHYMDRETAWFPDIPYFRSKLEKTFWIKDRLFDPLEKWANQAVQIFRWDTSTI